MVLGVVYLPTLPFSLTPYSFILHYTYHSRSTLPILHTSPPIPGSISRTLNTLPLNPIQNPRRHLASLQKPLRKTDPQNPGRKQTPQAHNTRPPPAKNHVSSTCACTPPSRHPRLRLPTSNPAPPVPPTEAPPSRKPSQPPSPTPPRGSRGAASICGNRSRRPPCVWWVAGALGWCGRASFPDRGRWCGTVEVGGSSRRGGWEMRAVLGVGSLFGCFCVGWMV